MKTDELIKEFRFVLSEKCDAGEPLVLVVKYYSNGDPGKYYINEELTLHSYYNSATFKLSSSHFDVDKLLELIKLRQKADSEVEVILSKENKNG